MKCRVLSTPDKQKRIVRARKLLEQVRVNKVNRTFFKFLNFNITEIHRIAVFMLLVIKE